MTECLKYSVIIPVYNAENTIKRCLDSLLNQIPTDAELLVINDGSKDNSSTICKNYANEYSVIKYFEKENGGVSSARNLGLDNATGEYILFADSDDYVEPSYWETIDSLVNKYHPDLLQFGFRDCGETTKERSTGDYDVKGDIFVAEKIDAAVRSYMFSALYARVYKRSVIQANRLRFEQNLMIGEDQVFIFAYAMHVNHLVSTSIMLYNVVLENMESLTRKRRDYLVKQLREVNNKMSALVEKSEFSENIKQIYGGAISWVYYRSAYSGCKELLKYNLTVKDRRRKIKEICRIYSADQVKPVGLKCQIIAFPVIHEMSHVIDALICRVG